MRAYLVDILAVGFFILEWTVYAVTLEHTAYGRDSLSARMNVYREVWVRRMLDREARMVDMQIMGALQNGTAFFASTSLIAVGGALALLRATNEALAVLGALPIDLTPSPALWEIKCVGLILIFVYAFFKFAWSYRLFNYVSILLGAMPPMQQRDTAEAEAHVMRTTKLFEAAGRHFNRGQRAFFFALGYLGWFVSPWVLFLTTAAVVIVTWRRQFASNAWKAMGRWLPAGKILRREAEIEHFPFAVAVLWQHRVGLTGLQRVDRALHQRRPFWRRAGLDQHRLGRELAFRRHERPQHDPELVRRRDRSRQFQAGLEMPPKLRDQTGCDVGRL